MPESHLILCGRASLSSRKKEWQKAKAIELRMGRQSGNVNLRISDITRRLTSTLSDLDLDLLEMFCFNGSGTELGLS